MINSVNLIKNNSVYFKSSNTDVKTVSKPVSNPVQQIKTEDKVEISTKKNNKTAKTIGYVIGTAITGAIILRKPIKQYKIKKEAEKIEQEIQKNIEEKVSTEVNKYKEIFAKTKVTAKNEVKDLLEKSKKESSLADNLTDGEINTIVAVKKSLLPAAIPLLINQLTRTPDYAITICNPNPEEYVGKQDEYLLDCQKTAENISKLNTYLSDLEKTSENSLQYVDSKHKNDYEIDKNWYGYGYSSNLKFKIENNYDIRDLGIVLDEDKIDSKKYSKREKAIYGAVIINNILYKNEENKEKDQMRSIIKICKNNENNEKTVHENNCDFIANDVRKNEKRRIEDEKRRKEEKKRIEEKRKKENQYNHSYASTNHKNTNEEDDDWMWMLYEEERNSYNNDDIDIDELISQTDFVDSVDFSHYDDDDDDDDDDDFDDGGMF